MFIKETILNLDCHNVLRLSSAAENIPRADLIRTLIKDIWDLRTAKLRSSIDTFIRSDTTHAKVNDAVDITCGSLSHYLVYVAAVPYYNL